MQLIPAVASYLGLQNQVRNALTDQHLQILANVALQPQPEQLTDPEILAELVEMHAVRLVEGQVKLNTAVFLEGDILRVSTAASDLGRELAEQLITVGAELREASPEVRNFLGGIIAAAQGPSKLLQAGGQAVNWRSYTGRYASTKVDFDQACPAFSALGPELQVKTVQQGAEYTAVFIGPGGQNYVGLIQALYPTKQRSYRRELLKYLTDAYGGLLAGKQQHEHLARSAEEVGIFLNGQPRPILVTRAIYDKFAAVVKRIATASCDLYAENIERVFACLRDTTAGKQGVPPESMIMHFGRYCRKALARELYAVGFFTDSVPACGSITVFYENEIVELNTYLGF